MTTINCVLAVDKLAANRPVSLAVRKLLDDIGPQPVIDAAAAAGFQIPQANEAAYSVSFGVAEASPEQAMSVAAAMSRGLVGAPAVAEVPHVIRRYRQGSTWVRYRGSMIDLRPYFANPTARAFLNVAASAAIRYQGRLPNGRTEHGTLFGALAGLPPQSGELSKSGTDARDDRSLTFGKAAIGARAGASWLAFVTSISGPVGGKDIELYPLATLARRETIARAADQ